MLVLNHVKIYFFINQSALFDITLGLKQREPLSLLLFIIFINDVTSFINVNKLTKSYLNQLFMYILLYADDIALLTTYSGSLQTKLECVYQYSRKWGLDYFCYLGVNFIYTGNMNML